MSKSKSEDPFEEVNKSFLEEKKRAMDNHGFSFYIKYCKMYQGMFAKLFADSKKPKWQALYGNYIKLYREEIKWAKEQIKIHGDSDDILGLFKKNKT